MKLLVNFRALTASYVKQPARYMNCNFTQTWSRFVCIADWDGIGLCALLAALLRLCMAQGKKSWIRN